MTTSLATSMTKFTDKFECEKLRVEEHSALGVASVCEWQWRQSRWQSSANHSSVLCAPADAHSLIFYSLTD